MSAKNTPVKVDRLLKRYALRHITKKSGFFDGLMPVLSSVVFHSLFTKPRCSITQNASLTSCTMILAILVGFVAASQTSGSKLSRHMGCFPTKFSDIEIGRIYRAVTIRPAHRTFAAHFLPML
jgi:hypothetical protein